MSGEPAGNGLEAKRRRMAQTVRLVVSTRERAPRSPAMERALKRLIWRYTGHATDGGRGSESEE